MRRLKLREWLSVSDAAQHLSAVFSETFTEFDLLRAGLDGHLKLSVRFVNGAIALRGRILPLLDGGSSLAVRQHAEVSAAVIPPGVPAHPALTERGWYTAVTPRFGRYEGRDIDWDDVPRRIFGVWDLPMIGNERFDVERRCQELSNGPAVKLTCYEGVFVEQPSELWIVHSQHYFGSLVSLPADIELVVRRHALKRLERRLSGQPAVPLTKALHKKERETISIIIGALAEMAGIDLSSPYKAAGAIQAHAHSRGVHLAENTIVKFLKDIPNLLERPVRSPRRKKLN